MIALIFIFNIILKGEVKDAAALQPLYLVDVYVKELGIGSATDEMGKFSLDLPPGIYDVAFSRIGYKEIVIKIIATTEDIYIKVLLDEVTIEIGEVVVATSSYSLSEQTEKHSSFSVIDVYNDPGGAAEIYWVVQSLPGAASGSDAAPIYPRGGSPDENITILDQTPIPHPFHQENVGGGLFSIFDPVIYRDVNIYLGGFPARYGNSLSSVIDIQTKYQTPHRLMGSFGLNNAAVNIAIEAPILNKLSLISSYQRNFTDLLLKDKSFETYPYWQNFTTKLTYNLNKLGGRIEIIGLLAKDAFEMDIDANDYNEIVSRSIFAFNWIDLLKGNLLSSLNLSYYNFSPRYYIPELYENKKNETAIQIKEDLKYEGNSNTTYEAGLSITKLKCHYYGLFTEDSTQWIDTLTPKIEYEDTVDTWTFGGYVQQETKIKHKFAFNIGLRADYLNKTKTLTFDPRFSLGYALRADLLFNFALGIYHQFANTDNFLYGKPNPLEAIHYIVGIEKTFGTATIKLESYYKNYRHLLLQVDDSLTNNGYGYSTGIELFTKISKVGPLSGWFGYGLCDSKRKAGTLKAFKNSEFNIPHNFNLTLSSDLPSNFNLGVKFRFAAGRPYTPILDVIYDSTSQKFTPIYGEELSARLPSYQRLDLRLQKKFLVFNFGTIVYFEITNLLDRTNPVYYIFSEETGKNNPFVLIDRTYILGFVLML